MKMLKKIICFSLFVFLMVMPSFLMAQPDPDPSDLCPNPRDPECPIDNGTVLLIAAVIGIASVKAFKYSNLSKKAMV
jgi:hypothetical protein